MAMELHQLDLFGGAPVNPVHIKANKQAKSIKKAKTIQAFEAAQSVMQNEPIEPLEIREEKPAYTTEPAPSIAEVVDDLPLVARAPMHLNAGNKQKRGRKSFASMEGEMDKIKVPAPEILKQRLYYPIGEVANWFNVNTSLIRYWEKEFKQLKPRKTRKGDRLFTFQDIEYLKQIYFLLREKKYSIDGAKTYLKNNKEKASKNIQMLNSLQNIKTFLQNLKASL